MKISHRLFTAFACAAMFAGAASAQSAPVDTLKFSNHIGAAAPASNSPHVGMISTAVTASVVNDYWSGKKSVTNKTGGMEVGKGMKFDIGTAGVDKVSPGAGAMLLKREGVASPPMATAANFWNFDSRTRIGAAHHLIVGLPPLPKIDATGTALAKMTSVDTKQNSFGAQNARGLAKNSLTGAGNDIMPVSLIAKAGGLGIPDGAGISSS